MIVILCVSLLCVHAQSYLTCHDPMDCSPPDSSVRGIFQAGILEWVAVPSSRGSSQPRNQTHVPVISALNGEFFTRSVTWWGQGLGAGES